MGLGSRKLGPYSILCHVSTGIRSGRSAGGEPVVEIWLGSGYRRSVSLCIELVGNCVSWVVVGVAGGRSDRSVPLSRLWRHQRGMRLRRRLRRRLNAHVEGCEARRRDESGGVVAPPVRPGERLGEEGQL